MSTVGPEQGSYREATLGPEPYGGGSSDWWQVPKEKKTLWGERSWQQDSGQPPPTWNIIVSVIANNHRVLITPRALKWQCHLMGSSPPPQDIDTLTYYSHFPGENIWALRGSLQPPQFVRSRTKIQSWPTGSRAYVSFNILFWRISNISRGWKTYIERTRRVLIHQLQCLPPLPRPRQHAISSRNDSVCISRRLALFLNQNHNATVIPKRKENSNSLISLPM